MFNKCVAEPKYIELYMNLADQFLTKFCPKKKEAKEVEKENPLNLNFKKLFLTLCQSKLENPDNDLLFLVSTEGKNEEVVMEKKARLYGSIRLIAELFVRGLAPDTFVKNCLDKLMKSTMEENIESAVQLLLRIGGKLYEYFAFKNEGENLKKKPKLWITVFNKESIDDYVDKLSALKQGDKISSRVKFLIVDLMRAKDEMWTLAYELIPPVPESKTNGKKKIVYRKKTGSTHESAPSEIDHIKKVEQRELRKHSINEKNVFGVNLELYHKSKIEEKIRVTCI